MKFDKSDIVAAGIIIVASIIWGLSRMSSDSNEEKTAEVEVAEATEEEVVATEEEEEDLYPEQSVICADDNEVKEEVEVYVEHIENDDVYTKVEERASFIGGNTALMKYLEKNLIYPADAKGKEGTVIVSLTINKDGSICDVEVIRALEHSFNTEAVRVVKSMPKWKPAKIQNKPVRSKFILPVKFRRADTK